MRMIIWLILLYVGFRIIKGFIAQRQSEPETKRVDDDAVRDPVCGVYVAKEDAVIGTVEGDKVYFCSMECLEKYRDQLERKEHDAIRRLPREEQ